MRARSIFAIVCAALIAAPLATPPAGAVDLEDARRQGGVLAEALRLGARGDWDAAQSRVEGEHDPVLSDIVLWRKLRAGEGSIEEYRAFTGRRGHWPGQKQLARAVFGDTPQPSAAAALTGRAAQNWKAFDGHMRRNNYDEAERLLDQVTVDAAGLGDPEIWQDRRRRLARRAARMGRADLAYRLATQPEIHSRSA